MNNSIICQMLVKSGRKLECQLEWYRANKDKDYCDNYDNIVYYGQYFKGVCDLAIALGFAESDIEIIIPEAWHYVNKEL